MIALSTITRERLRALFPPDAHDETTTLLEEECGDTLPFCDGPDRGALIERIRIAALKLSAGDVDKLVDAVALARVDWRDLLVAAGFGDDVDAHLAWRPERQTKSGDSGRSGG